MEVTDQFIENIKEMLKEPEKNLVNFPLKDLPEKQVIFAEMLTNPGIREVLTEDEWNSFKDKALVGLVKRLCNLKEVPQDDVSFQHKFLPHFNIKSKISFTFLFKISFAFFCFTQAFL